MHAASVVATLSATLVLLLALPAYAAAHAVLEETVPSNESTVETRPKELRLTFSEDVTVAFGAVKAFAPDGSRVEDGKATATGHVVTVPLDVSKPGTYAVSWRVISADSHPIQGASVFHYKTRSSNTAADAAASASESSRATAIAFGVARFIMLLGAVLGAGGALFALLIGPRSWRARFVVPGVAMVAIGSGAAFVLDAMLAGGFSVADALRVSVLEQQASSTYGRAALIRTGIALVCVVLAAVLLRSICSTWTTRRRVAWSIPFVVLACSLSLSGHAVAADDAWLRVPADMIHSLAAALWFGGLLQLGLMLRRDSDPADFAASTNRYSKVAMSSVAALVVTGSYAAFREIGLSWEALTTTKYGLLVIAKVVLLVAILPIANMNRTRHVPALASAQDAAEGRAELRRFVGYELVILVLVIAATAWLIGTAPAKSSLQPELQDESFRIEDGRIMQVTVDPAGTGRNEIHVYVFTKDQRLDDDVEEVRMTASENAADIGPLDIELNPSGPGHFTTTSATIPQPGDWELDVTVRTGDFDEFQRTMPVEVRQAGG